MTLDRLIQTLEELREELSDERGEVEVRLMTQPNWPFEWTIDGVALSTDMAAEDEDADEEEVLETTPVVYICEGRQLCYGSRTAWDVTR